MGATARPASNPSGAVARDGWESFRHCLKFLLWGGPPCCPAGRLLRLMRACMHGGALLAAAKPHPLDTLSRQTVLSTAQTHTSTFC